jgi:signal transduction protein with GAF and PtsI domain
MHKFELAKQPDDDLSALSMAERIAMVTRLTEDAWAFTGAELPDYPRDRMPGKVIRRGAA